LQAKIQLKMEGYIKFYAQVTNSTSVQLQQVVEQMLRQGLTELHLRLLLTTPDAPPPHFRGLSVPEPQSFSMIENSYTSI
jgi:hypothetical protein